MERKNPLLMFGHDVHMQEAFWRSRVFRSSTPISCCGSELCSCEASPAVSSTAVVCVRQRERIVLRADQQYDVLKGYMMCFQTHILYTHYQAHFSAFISICLDTFFFFTNCSLLSPFLPICVVVGWWLQWSETAALSVTLFMWVFSFSLLVLARKSAVCRCHRLISTTFGVLLCGHVAALVKSVTFYCAMWQKFTKA